MFRTLVILLLFLLLPLVSRADSERNRISAGASIGVPQLVAGTIEARVAGPLHLQANLGTIVVAHSASVRAIAVPQTLSYPFVYFGVGRALFSDIGDDTGTDETHNYYWAGFGWRLAERGAVPFLEFGLAAETEDVGSMTIAIGVGMLFRLR
jgi:hypothetical protein